MAGIEDLYPRGLAESGNSNACRFLEYQEVEVGTWMVEGRRHFEGESGGQKLVYFCIYNLIKHHFGLPKFSW